MGSIVYLDQVAKKKIPSLDRNGTPGIQAVLCHFTEVSCFILRDSNISMNIQSWSKKEHLWYTESYYLQNFFREEELEQNCICHPWEATTHW